MGKGTVAWVSFCLLILHIFSELVAPLCQVLLLLRSSISLLGVRFPESSKEEVQDQKQLLKDAAALVLSCQIPGLVRNRGGEN